MPWPGYTVLLQNQHFSRRMALRAWAAGRRRSCVSSQHSYERMMLKLQPLNPALPLSGSFAVR